MWLTPQYQTDSVARALLGQKAKQQHYYNRQARDLPPIPEGDGVRMQLPGERTWTPGVCTGSRGPRSYGVRVGEQEFRRNRRQLLHTREPVIPETETQEETPAAREPQALADQPGGSEDTPQTPTPPDAMAPNTARPLPQPTQALLRSEWNHKPPEWITAFVSTPLSQT